MIEADYYLGFSLSPTIGPKRFLSLISFFQSAENAWYGTKEQYSQAGITGVYYQKFDAYRDKFENMLRYTKQELKRKDIQFIYQTHEIYPQGLLDLENPPLGIFCKGNLSCLSAENKIAIVGTRKITSYGRDITKLFSSRLASNGVMIVSGMALGVDAIAHSAALEEKGKTIAVLGNGVDLPYPRENISVYQQILNSSGLIISEYAPGMPSTKGSFPARNRIIAALSSGVLVTEAGKDSGSLITAYETKKINRVVYATPGPITSSQSEGTGQLLQEGAKVVLRPEDILNGIGVTGLKKETIDIGSLSLDEVSKKLLTLLLHEPQHKDVLSKKMSLPIHEISKIVSGLELRGYVKDNDQGFLIAVV